MSKPNLILIIVLTLMLSGGILGCQRSNDLEQVAETRKSAMTFEDCWGHYCSLPGNELSELSAAAGKVVVENQNLKSTGSVRPKEWPTDSGTIEFYFNEDTRQFWARRVNKMNLGREDYVQGPLTLPAK